MRFGDWEGLDWNEITERHPELPKEGWTNPRLYIPRGGESFEALNERIASFLADLRVGLAPDGRALIVTHAGVLHGMVAVLAPAGSVPLRIRFLTASVMRLRLDGEHAELIRLNEQPAAVLRER